MESVYARYAVAFVILMVSILGASANEPSVLSCTPEFRNSHDLDREVRGAFGGGIDFYGMLRCQELGVGDYYAALLTGPFGDENEKYLKTEIIPDVVPGTPDTPNIARKRWPVSQTEGLMYACSKGVACTNVYKANWFPVESITASELSRFMSYWGEFKETVRDAPQSFLTPNVDEFLSNTKDLEIRLLLGYRDQLGNLSVNLFATTNQGSSEWILIFDTHEESFVFKNLLPAS